MGVAVVSSFHRSFRAVSVLLVSLGCVELAAAGPPAPRFAGSELILGFEEAGAPTSMGAAFLDRRPGRIGVITPDGSFDCRWLDRTGGLRVRPLGASAAAARGEAPRAPRLRVYTRGESREAALFGRVRIADLYDGIDLTFEAAADGVQYEFTVAAGADAAAIRLQFEEQEIAAAPDGSLRLGGMARASRPLAYYQAGERRIPVPVAFRVAGNSAGFEIERRSAVVIAFGLQLGGGGWDAAYAAASDAAGNLYLAGETASGDFPAPPGQSFAPLNRDVFVTKLDAASQVVYTAILGGLGNDAARAIALEPGGGVWVAGSAGSTFPTTADALRRTAGGGGDGFLARLDAEGRLSYSTYLGGSGSDVAAAVALDPAGGVYVAGYTASAQFPTTAGAPQRVYAGGPFDGFVCKLNAQRSLVYSTLVGGSGTDVLYAVAVDGAGSAAVAGYTDSANLPAVSAMQTSLRGSGDALAGSLNASGTAWRFLTYAGGLNADTAYGVAVDSAGSVFVAGATASASFPVSAAAYQSVNRGSYDAFVLKLTSSGALSYSTLYGGGGSDTAAAVAVDMEGYAWAGGYTNSANLPLVSPVQASWAGSFDGFVVRIAPDGSSLPFATYLGGTGDDRIQSLFLTPAGGVLLAGMTNSADFPPSMRPPLPPASSGYNAFAVNLSAGVPTPDCTISLSPASTSIASAGGAGSVSVGIDSRCSWIARSDTAWVQLTGGSSGTGSGGTQFYVGANGELAPRTGTVTFTSGTRTAVFEIIQAAADCPLSVTPSALPEFPAQGGSGSFLVSSPAGCSWTATTGAAWVHLTPGGGTGSASVAYQVDTNPQGAARSGNIALLSQSGASLNLPVTQSASACVYTLVPSQVQLPKEGGQAAVPLTVSPADCAWTATSQAPFLTVLAPASGSGNATLNFAAAPNPGGPRSGAISVGAGGSSAVLTVFQASAWPSSKVGFFRNGEWYLDKSGNLILDAGGVEGPWTFGLPGDVPLVGDWDGSGYGKIGVFRKGTWYLDLNGNGRYDGPSIDRVAQFGAPGDIPVLGNWDGGSATRIGVFRAGTWYLDFNGNGRYDGPSIDRFAQFGVPGDIPVVGNWDGGLATRIGVFRAGAWYLDLNGNGVLEGPGVDLVGNLGQAGDIPVTGDWTGNGRSKAGVFRAGLWLLDINGNANWDGATTDRTGTFGQPGDKPVSGDWDGSGVMKAGFFRGGQWYLDVNGNLQWDGTPSDRMGTFGVAGDIPVVGRWPP